ncbi:hypothetical protein AK812_SmicGene47106 [Symbiodinium microadriaticum]|uniref:Uncharacterized protein n=1 Tax=Symbiodinium microadriaticum TaxID=2951 RepID=A0A1Q9BSD9_SYMMI|nr:hypothetical protein AK812_SmicGene47106 [Symbiodinium microadriaticum]
MPQQLLQRSVVRHLLLRGNLWWTHSERLLQLGRRLLLPAAVRNLSDGCFIGRKRQADNDEAERPAKKAKTQAEGSRPANSEESLDAAAKMIAKNDRLAAKRKEIASATPAGALIPYVDSRGGVYRAKALAAAPTASPAPPLGECVHILPAGQNVAVPVYRRYIQVKDMERADVVLVQSLAEGLYGLAGLEARLHGKRLADREWALSKMQRGCCVAFACSLHFHLYLYLHQSFADAYPVEHKILLSSSAAFGAKLTASSKHLRVNAGELPERPKHPRLTFGVVSQEHFEKLALSPDGRPDDLRAAMVKGIDEVAASAVHAPPPVHFCKNRSLNSFWDANA